MTALPLVSGVVLRPFRGAADFAAMTAVANASSAADGIQVLRTPESMARDYAAFTACDPLQDCIVAEWGGEMVGYGRCWWVTLADGLTLHAQIGFVPGR
ncbi:hypothetical protein [Acidovorax sp.]|uniref:hypothetical protein n=1 Tax=Acidovorax sp. TaxID=1872122 RepID=UPI0026363DB6|nr:hypothetical protein [Acidovorax sp.]